MAKLNQLIAVEKNVKAESETTFTKAYQLAQKPDLFDGLVKAYEPFEEDGVALPGERKLIQATVPSLIDTVEAALTRLIDLTVTKDTANTRAAADIKVDGVVIADAVPVTTLLWLEKKLVDLRTFVSKLPVLDPATVWTFDAGQGVYVSEPLTTIRQKKVTEYITVAQATDKHPAQVAKEQKDVPEGRWIAVKQSGAMTVTDRNALLTRLSKLMIAVKQAREEANSIQVTDVKIGEQILGYLFR